MQLVDFFKTLRSLKTLSRENAKWAEVRKTYLRCIWLFSITYVLKLLTEGAVSILLLTALLEILSRTPLPRYVALDPPYYIFNKRFEDLKDERS